MRKRSKIRGIRGKMKEEEKKREEVDRSNEGKKREGKKREDPNFLLN